MQETGCDAVLFVRLSPYHPYRPLVMGWKLKLVDSRQNSIIWAADEVFDSANNSVAKAAKTYSERQAKINQKTHDSDRILMSPRRFGQYTLDSILISIPSPAERLNFL